VEFNITHKCLNVLSVALLDNSAEELTVNEWKITKELCLVLRPFEEATIAASEDKYMTKFIVIVL
jgi:hypothetical protein